MYKFTQGTTSYGITVQYVAGYIVTKKINGQTLYLDPNDKLTFSAQEAMVFETPDAAKIAARESLGKIETQIDEAANHL